MVSDYNYAESRVVWFFKFVEWMEKRGENTVIQLISPSSPNHSLLVNDTFHMMRHIMVEVGTDLWKSSGPTSLLMQGHLQRLPRTTSGWFLNISKDGGSTTPLATRASAESPSQYRIPSWCPNSTSCFSVCACCLSFQHCAPLKRASPHILMRILLSLLQVKQSSLNLSS